LSASKILPLETIAEQLRILKRHGKKVVHCHGCFDPMHVGHIKHLQAARRMGDILVVTVTPDAHVAKGEGRPIFTELLRAESLAALDCVDFVGIDHGPNAAAAIRLLRPDYYVKGQEFEHRSPPPPRLQLEIEALREAGGELRFTHEIVFSSTELVTAGLGTRGDDGDDADRPAEARRFLRGFRMRHSADAVLSGLADLHKLRVLVVGEAIVDEYRYCVPLGKSPKEAVVSNKEVRVERHAGGALACANHVSRFCGEVDLVTVLGGEDSQEGFVRDRLQPNVVPRFVVRPGTPTITKRRYLWEPFLTKLFEVAVLDDTPLPADLEDELLSYLDGALPGYDLAVVIDYGHGFLSPRAAALLAERARFLALNTQANAANLGFNLVTKYPRAEYVCIDEAEIRLAAGDRWRPVEELADQMRERLGGAAISVTRGPLGALVCGSDGARWEVPAVSRRVVDRLGAGDAYLSVTAPCVAAGMPMDLVGLVGSVVGALAVRIVGNRSSIEPADVGRFIATLLR
jgi:rfaE bifunctional protein nucleotidyltransferase chain/domain